MMAAAAVRELRPVDPQEWKAIAGTWARVPAVGSHVYYFPWGHAEHCDSPPDIPSAAGFSSPGFLCRATSVRLLADPDTDEVFARIHLARLLPSSPPSPSPAAGGAADGDAVSGLVSFPKILTPSDANNGGGFSVPRFCAEAIFPPLDLKADPPVQMIYVGDVHGKVWDFRHIYRGTPRRHLLTTGWSRFVNEKNLKAGDSVVFMKNAAGELSVGIRRSDRSYGPAEYNSSITPPAVAAKLGKIEGFSRNVRGRVPAASVVEGMRLAEMNQPFEVLYYPKAGLPEFVVAREAVDEAMRVYWAAGMRVRMSVEADDPDKPTWFHGTVSSVARTEAGPWPLSPWRMLQVTWDEPEVLQTMRNVSPWQVELESTSPEIQALFPVTKRFRLSRTLDFLSDALDTTLFEMTECKSKNVDTLSPSLFSHKTNPAGMQGARHDPICVPSLSNSVHASGKETLVDHIFGANTPQKTDVCTELSIRTTSQPKEPFSPSQRSTWDSVTGVIKPVACYPIKKVSGVSFQLFGHVIQIDPPVNDDDNKEYGEKKNAVPSLEFSLRYAPKGLLETYDVSCQRVSA